MAKLVYFVAVNVLLFSCGDGDSEDGSGSSEAKDGVSCLWENTTTTPNIVSCGTYYDLTADEIEQLEEGCPQLPGGKYLSTNCDTSDAIGKCSGTIDGKTADIWYYPPTTAEIGQAFCDEHSGTAWTSL